MSSGKVGISIWSNNTELKEYFVDLTYSDLRFENYETNSKYDYLAIFLDLSQNYQDQTGILLEIILNSKEKNRKIVIIALTELNGSGEKIIQLRKFLAEISNEESLCRLIICQDLYTLSPNSTVTELDKYLATVVLNKSIEITKKGNFYYYPCSSLDLIEIIKKSLFISNTNGKEFYLVGEKISDLNLAYLLSKNIEEYCKAELDINAEGPSTQEKVNYYPDYLKTSSALNYKSNQDFEQNLKKYISETSQGDLKLSSKSVDSGIKRLISKTPFSKLFHHYKKYINSDSESPLKEIIKNKTIKTFEIVLATVCLVYLSSSVFFIASSIYSLKNLEKTLFFLKKGDISQSVKYLNNSILFKKIGESNYQLVSPIINFFAPVFNRTNQNLLSLLGYTQTTLQNLHQTFGLSETIYKSINNSKTVLDYGNLALALKSNLQQSYDSISQIEILLNKTELPKTLTDAVKQNIEYKQLKESQEQIGQIINIVDLIPSTLGDTKPSNLFILVQNNNEQRSTGGVITFVYQLGIEKGRVFFKKAFLPDEIDKIDSFVLEPPPIIEKFTGDTVWRLKDMNYNPDFPQTATNIAWYLEKKLKVKPDTIIALNSSSLNLDNIQKLVEQVLNQNMSLLDFGRAGAKAISAGNLNLWTSDVKLEKNLLNQSFSGSIRDYTCHPAMSTSRSCIPQTFHLNFSNFSLIPLNEYLQKNIKHTVTPTVLSVEHQISVEYIYSKNTPLVNRNLLEAVQLYVPKGSTVVEIKLNDEVLPLSLLAANEEGTLDRYQFPLSTTLNTKQNLYIKYSYPLADRVVLPVAYSITDLKQSGSNSTTSILEIEIPERSKVSAITFETTSQPGKIYYKQNFSPATFGFNLVPKQQ